MSGNDLAGILVPHDRFGDRAKGGHARVRCLIDMEVGVHAEFRRYRKERIKSAIKVRNRICDTAEHASIPCRSFRYLTEFTTIVDRLDTQNRYCLQLDPVLPFRSHLVENRPGDQVLGRSGIQMGPDGPGTVRERASQRKIHAPLNIPGIPVPCPVI